MEKNKKIGNEQAESLKRRIIEGSTKFVKSGAMIPEIEKEAKQNPRQLLAPEPKLLAAPMGDFDTKDSSSSNFTMPAESDTGLDNYTASDQTLLRAFQKSAGKKETGKGKKK